jgi:hypothetical protein
VAGMAIGVGGAATLAAAWRAAGRLVGSDPLDRAFAAAVLALGGLCAVLLALGICGLLTRAATTVTLVLLGALVIVRVPSTETAWRRPEHRRPEWLIVIGLGALTAGVALALGLKGYTTSNDTLHYHAPNAGTWLHAHSLLTLPVATPGYLTNAYPSDHTLTGLWLMLATGADQLAYAVNVAWGLLAVLSAAVLTRALGGRATIGALLALGVVLAPVTFATQANSLLSDIAAAAGIVAGAAAALRAAAGPRSTEWAVLAGVGLGLAAGRQYTALLPAAAVVALPLVMHGRRGLRPALTMVAAAAPLVLFWLVRNTVEFGNPLYPQAVGPLAGYTSPLARFDTPIATHILEGHGEIVGRWLRLARDLVGFAFVLPLGAAAAGVVGWRRRRRGVVAAAGVVLVSFAGYLWTPFTGGGPDGTPLLIGSQLRYALPAFLLAAPVVAAVAGRRLAIAAALPMLVFGAVKIVEGKGARADVDLTTTAVLSGLAFGVVALAIALRDGHATRRAPAPVLAALAAVLVAGATALVLHEQAPRPPTVTEALLVACPDPHVGVVAAQDVRSLMGREFELPVVAVDEPAEAGRRPIPTGPALDRRIAALAPDVVVAYPGPTQPAAWRGPPGWKRVARVGRATFFAPPGGCRR